MSGEIALSYYSPRGQEIVAAATAQSLRRDDYVVTTYRGIHDQIAKGVPLRLLFAEYFGKVTGSCKGKGGPMHVTHPESGVMLTTGIVGSGLPIANGLALAAVLRNEDRVVVITNFGDGASNIGAFHEALNLAALWKLPVVFLCQNNEFAEHTTYANGTSCANVADRAVGLRHAGRHRRRQRSGGDVQRGGRSDRRRERRQRSDTAGSQDLPLHGALLRR